MLQGGQTRTFGYDSLSQLTCVDNPESGHSIYDYDPAGNLLRRADARGSITTYGYDGLNRLKTKIYNEGTGMATLDYDTDRPMTGETGANARIGRLTRSLAAGNRAVTGTMLWDGCRRASRAWTWRRLTSSITIMFRRGCRW